MAKMVCTACGSVGEPTTITKGSIFIEIILWICFFIPGLIYSIWRLSSRHRVCVSCGSANIVPLNSPKGRQLAQEKMTAQSAPKMAAPMKKCPYCAEEVRLEAKKCKHCHSDLATA